MVDIELAANVEGRRLVKFCDEKQLCVPKTWFRDTRG